jgi:hypothetical protein
LPFAMRRDDIGQVGLVHLTSRSGGSRTISDKSVYNVWVDWAGTISDNSVFCISAFLLAAAALMIHIFASMVFSPQTFSEKKSSMLHDTHVACCIHAIGLASAHFSRHTLVAAQTLVASTVACCLSCRIRVLDFDHASQNGEKIMTKVWLSNWLGLI